MKRIQTARRFVLLFVTSLLIIVLGLPQVNAQQPLVSEVNDHLIAQEITTLRPFEQVIQNSEKLEGLFITYQNKDTGKLYLELKPEQLNQNFLCFMNLDSGLGEAGIISGTNLRDILFQFRRLQNQIQFVVPNINFRTDETDPQARSINRSFSESVLQTLPILSIHPERKTILIEIGDLLISQKDLPGLMIEFSSFLNNTYAIDSSKSYISGVQVFPNNVEIESVFGFSSQSPGSIPFIDSLPDSRTFNLRVRYSFLAVPENNGYRPRFADQRVGYFTTTYKDLSGRHDSSVIRYLNRWNLEKQDPNAPLSPPVKPIVFWLENTIPLDYREAIKEGILMWNKAFEKAGFQEAIQVEQMPDNADWNPADVRYNTIRWSTSFKSSFNGYGPSHVNPLTGEILDADIVLESSAVRSLKEGAGVLIEGTTSWLNYQNAETSNTDSVSNSNPCQVGLYAYSLWKESQSESAVNSVSKLAEEQCFRMASNEQLAIGSTALSLLENALPSSRKLEEYIHQYLKMLVAHEVGHTLGLRHNFQGSTLLAPEELHNTEITRTKGLTSSVMDYLPVNLAPQGTPQGDYFTTQIGPYDQWAIEYGYTPIAAQTPGEEVSELQEIAKRASQPELAYATDEDFWGVFLDPATNTRDLSNDMLQYSQWQFENAIAMWKRLENYTPSNGQGYDRMRKMFDTIFDYYYSQAVNLTLYIGGQSFSRTKAGGMNQRLPFEPIAVEKQREALKTIEKYVFQDDIFKFSPNLLNQLAPARWSDWANPDQHSSLDYPITQRITWFQRHILRELMSPTRLLRLRDLELKTAANQALTLPELFETLQNSIWKEVLSSNGELEITSIRRSLQREHLDILSEMVLRKIRVNEDAETLAWYQLRQLNEVLQNTLNRHSKKMNAYTLAHLEQTQNRIQKILEAEVESN